MKEKQKPLFTCSIMIGAHVVVTWKEAKVIHSTAAHVWYNALGTRLTNRQLERIHDSMSQQPADNKSTSRIAHTPTLGKTSSHLDTTTHTQRET